MWSNKRLDYLDSRWDTNDLIAGSLESPLAASPAQSYHPSSTYFHQQCQWFFDPPPSRQLILKISTAQKMGSVLIFWHFFARGDRNDPVSSGWYLMSPRLSLGWWYGDFAIWWLTPPKNKLSKRLAVKVILNSCQVIFCSACSCWKPGQNCQTVLVFLMAKPSKIFNKTH